MSQSGFLIGPGIFSNMVSKDDIGVANGVAGLDANGEIPSSQLPSYVDDVVEGYYYNSNFYEDAQHTTQITPATGKIYVSIDTGFNYRWSGSVYTQIAKYNEATSSQSGLMPAADKAKLDLFTIVSGALCVTYEEEDEE